MSLEIAITENTAAIRELIAKLSTGAVIPRDTIEIKKPVVNKVEIKKEQAPVSEPTQTASDNSKTSSKESTEANGNVTYQDVAAAITKVSRQVSRDAAVALLAKFDAKKGPDLKPEQFADVVAACEKALA